MTCHDIIERTWFPQNPNKPHEFKFDWFKDVINRITSIKCVRKYSLLCKIGWFRMPLFHHCAINFKLKVKWRDIYFTPWKPGFEIENLNWIMINLLLEHCATHTTVKEIESCVKRYNFILVLTGCNDGTKLFHVIWRRSL